MALLCFLASPTCQTKGVLRKSTGRNLYPISQNKKQVEESKRTIFNFVEYS